MNYDPVVKSCSGSSHLGVAQVLFPRRQLFRRDTVGEERCGLGLGQRGNDHDFVTGLKRDGSLPLESDLHMPITTAPERTSYILDCVWKS